MMDSSSTAITSIILFLLFLIFCGATLYEIKSLNRRKRLQVRTRRRYAHVVSIRRRARFCLFLIAMIASGFASFFVAFYPSSVDVELSVERADGTANMAPANSSAFETEKEEGAFFFTPASLSSEEQANDSEPLLVRVSYMPNIPVLVSEFEENKEL